MHPLDPLPDPSDDDDCPMPSAEALLSGTLALMTGYAQSVCERQRGLMARKIASNLFFLQAHPGVSADFRTMLGTLRSRWAGQATETAGIPTHAWLRPPHALQ